MRTGGAPILARIGRLDLTAVFGVRHRHRTLCSPVGVGVAAPVGLAPLSVACKVPKESGWEIYYMNTGSAGLAVVEKLKCPECGATEARNGRAFTARTLRVHRARLHRKLVQTGGMRDLSPRQGELMELVVAGFTEAEMAARLDLSVTTVHTHMHNIYRKMGVRNRAEAVMRWLRRNDRLKGPNAGPPNETQFRYCPACGYHLAGVSVSQ
jgi:DNA-binding CsgD family transcriptional regulator